MNLDLYYFGLDRRNGQFHRGTGLESRHSWGTRLYRATGQTEPVDLDWELVAQTGTFAGAPVRAWYAASETGYTFQLARLRPRFALKLNAASGDRNQGSRSRLGTFNALFPDTRDFREQAFPGPSNVSLVRPLTELRFPIAQRVVNLTLACDWFWRTSTADGIYSFSGVPYPVSRQPAGGGNRFIGIKPAAVAQLPVNRHWTLTAIWANLFAGAYVKAAFAGRSPSYAGLVLSVRL